jgi:hypothetical protein
VDHDHYIYIYIYTGTVTTKSQLLEERILPEGESVGGAGGGGEEGAMGGAGHAIVVTRTAESSGGVNNIKGGTGGVPPQKSKRGHDSLGLSFNLDLSDAERVHRAAVLLPFQVA